MKQAMKTTGTPFHGGDLAYAAGAQGDDQAQGDEPEWQRLDAALSEYRP